MTPPTNDREARQPLPTAPETERVHVRRLIVLLALTALLLAAATSDTAHRAASDGLDVAQTIIRDHEVAGLALFACLAAVSAIAFFLSSAVLVPVAVYVWGAAATVVILWAAWLLGAAVSYWLGRHPGRRILGWLVPKSGVARYEAGISANARFPLIVLFQLAVPSEIPGWVLGALRYPFGRYLVACAIAELPYAIGAVYLGEAFVRRQYVVLVTVALGGALLSTVALFFLHRSLARERAAATSIGSGP